MKRVVLKLKQAPKRNFIYLVNNEEVFFENKIAKIDLEGERLELEIFSVNDLETWGGFFLSLLFYFIGFFGLFSGKYYPRTIRMRYHATMNVSEEKNEIKIVYQPTKIHAKAIELEGDFSEYIEQENLYEDDPSCKKRTKIFMFFKKGYWLIFAVILVVIVLLICFGNKIWK